MGKRVCKDIIQFMRVLSELNALINIVQTFVVGLGHSWPVQKDHCIVTLLLEVGFHPGSYYKSFRNTEHGGGEKYLQCLWHCYRVSFKTWHYFLEVSKVGCPRVLWFYLTSAIPLFLPVSTNSKSLFLPNTRSPTWTLPKCTTCFLCS